MVAARKRYLLLLTALSDFEDNQMNFSQAMLLQLTTAVGALLGTYISLLAEGMGESIADTYLSSNIVHFYLISFESCR